MAKIVLIDQQRFNEALIKKGFSKTELARVICVSRPTIINISKGARNPSPRTAKKILEVLEVEFDEIFEVTETTGGECAHG